MLYRPSDLVLLNINDIKEGENGCKSPKNPLLTCPPKRKIWVSIISWLGYHHWLIFLLISLSIPITKPLRCSDLFLKCFSLSIPLQYHCNARSKLLSSPAWTTTPMLELTFFPPPGFCLLHHIVAGVSFKKRKQNINRDVEVKNNLTMDRGEWGGDSEEKGLQELL